MSIRSVTRSSATWSVDIESNPSVARSGTRSDIRSDNGSALAASSPSSSPLSVQSSNDVVSIEASTAVIGDSSMVVRLSVSARSNSPSPSVPNPSVSRFDTVPVARANSASDGCPPWARSPANTTSRAASRSTIACCKIAAICLGWALAACTAAVQMAPKPGRLNRSEKPENTSAWASSSPRCSAGAAVAKTCLSRSIPCCTSTSNMDATMSTPRSAALGMKLSACARAGPRSASMALKIGSAVAIAWSGS